MRKLDEILEGKNIDEFLLECYLRPKVFLEKCMGLEVKDFHLEWFDAFRKNKRNVVVSFRGSGKTEILAVGFFLWISMFEQNKTMIVVSKTLDMSKEIISRVRNYIEHNELLYTLKPDKSNVTWTKTEIRTSTGCRMICRPYGANIRTWHVNYLLMDEAAFYEDKAPFYFDILPIVNAHNGHLMVISTPRDATDLVHELMKKTMYWSKKYPALDEHGKPLWAERYSKKKLEEIKKEQGGIKFTREYLCKIVSDEMALFPVNMIMEACDDNLEMRLYGKQNESFYFGADFAISATGNYSVFTVVRKQDNMLVVDFMYRPDRGTAPKKQESIIKDIYTRYNIVNGYGDKGSFGALIIENLIADGINIKPFDFQAKKEELLLNLRKKFENKQIIIPTSPNDPYTKATSDILIKELSEMVITHTKLGKETYKGSGAHDDSVMALALAVWAADEIMDVDVMLETLDG